mmetsp:Transcript_62610/g.198241  ORF Transcript_62610/g.198241 Transcript_62610/m.198241 type:complete len:382 (-) Transcript_62610:234-1379(-)
MPVKGRKEQSMANWRSHLSSRYRGRIEYVFVVEDERDQACAAVRQFQGEFKDVAIKLVSAGPSTSCSQKIHNMLVGAASVSPSSDYVLFIDDDIHFHGSTLCTLVAEIESDPGVFLVTGFPFDIPHEHGDFGSYCMMAYHLPLLVAFSIPSESRFAWGGCMMMSADALRRNSHGVVDSLRFGGYSDDLIIQAVCREHGLKILSPGSAVFPNCLDVRCSMSQYWNYLRRQVYVLDTYYSRQNYKLNLSLLVTHSYLSLVLVLSFFAFIMDTAELSRSWRRGGGGSHQACSEIVFLYLCACIFAFCSARWMASVVASMFGALGSLEHQAAVLSIRWWKVVPAMLVTNVLFPVCAVLTLLSDKVVWAGITYTKHRGKIVLIERP